MVQSEGPERSAATDSPVPTAAVGDAPSKISNVELFLRDFFVAMKTFLRFLQWTGVVLAVVVLAFVVAVFARQHRTFDAPLPAIHASTDSAVVARGRYLVYGPAHCAQCHTPNADAAALNDGKELPLCGGYVFDLDFGKVYTSNLTPDATGIANISDGQITRAIRHGVRHDNLAMLPFMQFQYLSDEDLTAIVSFLRSQPPVRNDVSRFDLNFLGKAINAFLIKPDGAKGEVAKTVTPDTTAAYGKYMVNAVANCRSCHTERSQLTAEFIGEELAGGNTFEHPEKGFTLTTPNLTPDPKTGRIHDWTFEMFRDRFRTGKLIPESEMPWNQFKHLSDNDLNAIYKYLMSVPPVENEITVMAMTEKQ